MPINVQQRQNGRAQLRVKHPLLPRAFFFTFATKAEALAYGAQLHGLLDRGIVPAELAGADDGRRGNPALLEMVRVYMKGFPVTESDAALLRAMSRELTGVRWRDVTFLWVERYVTHLKRERRLAPGSIRKRIGVLARVADYWLRAECSNDANPFRLLPRGYSIYSAQDACGRELKRDIARDRRLDAAEETRIEAALAGVRRLGRQRPWPADDAFRLLFHVILHQGMRLQEAIVARVADIDFEAGVWAIRGSKGHRGRERPRTMPIHPSLAGELRSWCAKRPADGRVFDFWRGDDAASLRRACNAASARFATLFAYAGADGLREHDLRHEACCRWLAMRDARGAWLFSEVEICRMFGWSDTRIMLRYANIRGSDLAARLLDGEGLRLAG